MTPTCPSCGQAAVPEGRDLGGYPLMRCGECTLRFAHTAVGVSVDYDRIYETPEYLATQVDVLRTDFDPAQFVNHGTYKAFFDRAPLRPGGTLLDVGCGVGRFCHAAHSQGWQVLGIDVSDRAIEAGRKHAPFPMRRATAEDLLDAPERFDAVTAFEVLEHLPRPVDFLRQARALTRPDGVVFCTVPNWDCALVQSAERSDWLPPVHLNFFTQQALGRAGELAGFATVKTGVIQIDPPRLSWKRRLLSAGRSRPADGPALGLWLLGLASSNSCASRS